MSVSTALNAMRPVAAVALVGALAFGMPAHAAPVLEIALQSANVNGGAITTVATSAAGVVSFTGTYDGFTSSISAAAAPALPSGNLNTSSLQISSSSPGSISVYITAQGLTAPLGVNNFLSSFTSNTFQGSAVSVVETTYLSTANALFGGTQIGTATFTGGPVVSEVTSASPNLPNPYSETAVYTVTIGSGFGSLNDTINIATVPEPMTLSLMAGGLLALGAVRKRFI